MQNRRQFFTMLARGGLLAKLTVVSGNLIRRWAEADACSQDFTCGKCKLSGHCQLAEADDYRLEKAKRQNVKP